MKKVLRSLIQEEFPLDLRVKIELISKRRDITNAEKQEEIFKALREFNIKDVVPLGPGTNRYAFKLKGFVVKVATDHDGKIDNLKEFKMAKRLFPYVTKTYDVSENGTLLVAEYIQPFMSYGEMAVYGDKIKDILKKLSSVYLIGDVGLTAKNYANWGLRVGSDEPVCLDFAYVYDVSSELFVCKECKSGSMLVPNSDFTALICSNPACQKKYLFEDIRRRIGNDLHRHEIGDLAEEGYKLTSSNVLTDLTPERSNYLIRKNKKTEKVEKLIEEEAPLVNFYIGDDEMEDFSMKITDSMLSKSRIFEAKTIAIPENVTEENAIAFVADTSSAVGDNSAKVLDARSVDLEAFMKIMNEADYEDQDREDDDLDDDIDLEDEEDEIDEDDIDEEIYDDEDEDEDDDEDTDVPSIDDLVEEFFAAGGNDEDEEETEEVSNGIEENNAKFENFQQYQYDTETEPAAEVVVQAEVVEAVEEPVEVVEVKEEPKPVKAKVEEKLPESFCKSMHRAISKLSNNVKIDIYARDLIDEILPYTHGKKLLAGDFYTEVQNAVFKSLVAFTEMNETLDQKNKKEWVMNPNTNPDQRYWPTCVFLSRYWMSRPINSLEGSEIMKKYRELYGDGGIQREWIPLFTKRLLEKLPIDAAGADLVGEYIAEVWCPALKDETPDPVDDNPPKEEKQEFTEDDIPESFINRPGMTIRKKEEDKQPDPVVVIEDEIPADESPVEECCDCDECCEEEDEYQPIPVTVEIRHDDETGYDDISVITEYATGPVSIPLIAKLADVNGVSTASDPRNGVWGWLVHLTPDMIFSTQDPKKWIDRSTDEPDEDGELLKFVILGEEHGNAIMGIYRVAGVFLESDEGREPVVLEDNLRKINEVLGKALGSEYISQLQNTLECKYLIYTEADIEKYVDESDDDEDSVEEEFDDLTQTALNVLLGAPEEENKPAPAEKMMFKPAQQPKKTEAKAPEQKVVYQPIHRSNSK